MPITHARAVHDELPHGQGSKNYPDFKSRHSSWNDISAASFLAQDICLDLTPTDKIQHAVNLFPWIFLLELLSYDVFCSVYEFHI